MSSKLSRRLPFDANPIPTFPFLSIFHRISYRECAARLHAHQASVLSIGSTDGPGRAWWYSRYGREASLSLHNSSQTVAALSIRPSPRGGKSSRCHLHSGPIPESPPTCHGLVCGSPHPTLDNNANRRPPTDSNSAVSMSHRYGVIRGINALLSTLGSDVCHSSVNDLGICEVDGSFSWSSATRTVSR